MRHALMPKEQPVPTRRPRRATLLQESPKRRHARAGADHDNRGVGIARKREIMRWLHIDWQRLARHDAFGQERRSDANSLAFADNVTHGVDRKR